MPDREAQFIAVADLRIGHYVFIDLGWISHPFPFGSFKIRTAKEIAEIKALGIERIRFDPDRSDPPPAANDPVVLPAETPAESAQRHLRERLAAQRSSLKACERQFTDASRNYRQLAERARTQPAQAREQSERLVGGMVDGMLAQEESCIRLLAEQAGERAALHAVNVTVISLLLGRACALSEASLHEIGMAALLHDLGKADLPDRIRWRDGDLSIAEARLYQEHVALGVAIAQRMNLPSGVLLAIGQHHEAVDGSGYPLGLKGERITPAGRVVALVNHYDNLCNPNNPAFALTPHEALSQLYAQAKGRFDPSVLGSFIRMMGIYPPGSVVQLTDDRHALVVSVNSARPLKPQVIVFDPTVPRDEALILALDECKDLGIRRSLKAVQLPKAAMEYLSPQARLCYFFERARLPDSAEVAA